MTESGFYHNSKSESLFFLLSGHLAFFTSFTDKQAAGGGKQ